MKTISATAGQRLADFAAARLSEVKADLATHGGVLFRGFDTRDAATMKDILALFGHVPMQDARWSSPRHAVGEGAFTSTDYPADQTIVLHSEMSYARQWPRLLLFQCKQPAASGGATTVCHLKTLSVALGDLVDEFHEREVLYIRNFRPGVDVRWQDAFGTDDPAEVERIGALHGLEVEWQAGGVLKTFQHAQGAVVGEDGPLWFNQAHLFHPSQLPPATRAGLTAAFGTDGLPRNAVFGDGEAIPDATIAHILATLARHTEGIAWQADDLAVVDNMRWMHGRAPFTGERTVRVAMGGPQKIARATPLFQ